MVHRCCISSCGMNVRVAEAKGLSYHGFPNKEPLREQWIQAIIPHLDKPETFKIVAKYTRVCSRHFRKKDYAVDIKKRARLNSNAVPSVFPRKNSPIIIPNVLPSPAKAKAVKTEATISSSSSCSNVFTITSGSMIPATASIVTSTATTYVLSTPTSRASDDTFTTASPQFGRISLQLDPNSEDRVLFGGPVSLSREYIIESATLTDDQLTLTVHDADTISSSSISQEDLSQSSNFSLNEDDSNEAPQKKRKRNKWNRSAFDRPAKGMKKKVSSEEDNIDGVGEALAEISLSTLLAITNPDLQEKIKAATNPGGAIAVTNSIEGTTCLQTVTLPLDNTSVQNINPEQVQHLNSIEQELLQSIQAVSLHCGEHEGSGSKSLESQPDISSDVNHHATYVHHSSEESIFSTGDEMINPITTIVNTLSLGYQTTSTTDTAEAAATEAALLSQMGELDPEERVPTLLEIENLANHLNNSLFTGFNVPITLSVGLEDLHLPSSESTEQDTSTASSSSEDIQQLFIAENAAGSKQSKSANSSIISSPAVSRKKKSSDVRLSGVSKKHKKERWSGQFSVERFRNLDKDIEYYTGFSTYRSFETFFRSLEAYVERLRVTDVMYGVTNLDKLDLESPESKYEINIGNRSDSEFVSPLPPPPAFDEPQKKRPFHGRSMSRIDELFMTVMRLRRKLPEKVLGHMFCISQPTVSRIIRAWTVLLSKLIDHYPIESAHDKSKTGKGAAEHTYTSRGLGIPESFRQLFHSELAQSIVVTSVSAKDKKVATQKPSASVSTCSSPSSAKRSRKCKSESIGSDFLSDEFSLEAPAKPEHSSVITEDVCDLLDPNSALLFNQCVDLEVEGTDFFTDFTP